MISASKRDTALFLTCFLLLCIEVIFMLTKLRVLPIEFPWDRRKIETNTIGEIVEKKNTLKNRSSGNLSWYPLAKGDKIAAGDLIMTGENSSAQIKIDGEGNMQLGPSTFISFNVDRSNPKKSVLDLQVEQGSVKLSSRSLPVTVRIKDKRVELKQDTEIILSQTMEAKTSNIVVEQGELSVVSGKETTPETLNVKKGETIKLSVATEESTKEKTVAMQVMPPPSLKPVDYFLQSPATSSIHRISEDISFAWQEIPEAKNYILQVSRFSDFKELLIDKKTTSTSENLKKFEAGQYYWRVKAEHEKLGEWPFSTTSSFTVKAPLAPPKPKGARKIKRSQIPISWEKVYASLSNTILPEAIAEDKRITFIVDWEKTEGAVSYLFEIAEDEKFLRPLIKKEVKETTIELEVPERERYYWRVSGKDADGEKGLSSPPQIVLLAEVMDPVIPKKEIVEKSIPEKPKIDLPSGLDSLSIGATANYTTQTATGEGIQIETSGFPLGKIELAVVPQIEANRIHFKAWYAPKKYTSKNNLPEEFQISTLYQKEFGARLLWEPLDVKFPFLLGLHFDRWVQFERVSREGAFLKDLNLYSVVLGTNRKWGSTHYLRSTLLLEGTPLGEAKGAALDARIDLGYKAVFFETTPELNFGLRPSYYIMELYSQKVFTLSAYFGLCLRYDFEIN